MYHPIRTMSVLLAFVGATGLAHADGEGGPGDSGAGGTTASASAAMAGSHGQAKQAAHKGRTSRKANARRANGSPDAASRAKPDGSMSNGEVGKGG